jgi:hypothetical protein
MDMSSLHPFSFEDVEFSEVVTIAEGRSPEPHEAETAGELDGTKEESDGTKEEPDYIEEDEVMWTIKKTLVMSILPRPTENSRRRCPIVE